MRALQVFPCRRNHGDNHDWAVSLRDRETRGEDENEDVGLSSGITAARGARADKARENGEAQEREGGQV
jgi:hypothetical protein